MAWGWSDVQQLVQERARPRRPELAVHPARVLATHARPRPRRLRIDRLNAWAWTASRTRSRSSPVAVPGSAARPRCCSRPKGAAVTVADIAESAAAEVVGRDRGRGRIGARAGGRRRRPGRGRGDGRRHRSRLRRSRHPAQQRGGARPEPRRSGRRDDGPRHVGAGHGGEPHRTDARLPVRDPAHARTGWRVDRQHRVGGRVLRQSLARRVRHVEGRRRRADAIRRDRVRRARASGATRSRRESSSPARRRRRSAGRWAIASAATARVTSSAGSAIPRRSRRAVAYLASDDAAFVTGEILRVDGGFTAHTPTYATDRRADI